MGDGTVHVERDPFDHGHGCGADQPPRRDHVWDLHRFKHDGLIVETWNVVDGLAIMQQLKAS